MTRRSTHLPSTLALALCLLATAACKPGPTPEQRRAAAIAETGAWRKDWRPPTPAESDLIKGARTFASSALGAEPRSLQEVQGLREKAVCGVAGGRRFIYREERRPIVEGEFPPAAFQSAVDGWCPAGWPQTP